jgi:hypothetical protein
MIFDVFIVKSDGGISRHFCFFVNGNLCGSFFDGPTAGGLFWLISSVCGNCEK